MKFDTIEESVTEIVIDGIGTLVLNKPAEKVQSKSFTCHDFTNNKGEPVPPISRGSLVLKQGDSVLATIDTGKSGAVWAIVHVNVAEEAA